MTQFANPDAYLESLVESWGDLVDPMDSLRSESAFFGGLLGGRADRADARRDGDYCPHFSDELRLAAIRGTGSWIAETDPVGINIIETLTSYVIGEGMAITAVDKPNDDTDAAELAWHAQQVIDEFIERTNLVGGLDAELFGRTRKAGERFVHVLDQGGGIADIEIVEPSWVTEPLQAGQVVQYYGMDDLAGANWKYGIATPRNRPAQPLAYFVMRYGDYTDQEVIPAERMVHTKVNVETGVKRGLTDFYGGAEEWIADSKKTLRNIIKGAGIQAAIAYIRKHAKGATNAAIESAADSVVEFQTRMPSQDGATFRNVPTERYHPGKILDHRGFDVMYGPMGTPVGPQLVTVVEASLRHAGRRWGFPEDMISGNASDTNYASILEAHTPFTIQMKRAQRVEAQATQRMMWMVLEIACQAGRIPADIETLKSLVKVEVTPPDIEIHDRQLEHTIRKDQHASGLLSMQTWAAQEGLDYEQEQKNRAEEEPVEAPEVPGGDGLQGEETAESLRYKRIAFSLLEDCGANGPGGGGFRQGNTCAKGGGGPTRGTSSKATSEKKDSKKSARAKANYNPATKAKQDASEELETKIARELGATSTGDNLPMDVIAKDGMVGLEVKMVHDGKHDKVHMRRDSRERKEAWVREKRGRKAWTVIVDNRANFECGKHRDKYSGHDIYYKEGVGAFRFSTMHKASSFKDLKKKLGL